MNALLILAMASSAYLAALPGANLVYVTNIVLHPVLGLVVCGALLWEFRRSFRAIPLAPWR